MTDDLTYADAPSGVPSGSKIATDDVGGAHYQRIKMDLGGDGASSPVVGALPVIPGTGEKLIGFGGIVEESIVEETALVGTNTINFTVVPSGEIYVIRNIAFANDDTNPSRVIFEVSGLATAMPLYDEPGKGVALWTTWKGFCLMQAGDFLRGFIFGCTAGDKLTLRYSGYKFAAP